MRMLMLPAHVTLRGAQPVLVSWREPVPESPRPAGLTEPSTPSRLHQRPVVRVLDRWRYDGRWWEHDIHRDYLLLELRGGSVVELFREGEAWCVARAND